MEMPLNARQPLNRWSVGLFVFFVLSVVVLPVAVAYWPIERSRWLLAAADNALESRKEAPDAKILKAQTLMDQAITSYPEIENSLDFARTSFLLQREELVRSINSLEFSRESFPLQPDVINRAIKVVLAAHPLMRPHAANVLSEILYEMKDFDAAYRVLLAGYPKQSNRIASQRNNLAYNAALANRDVEAALVEIELALAEKKSDLYDTAMYLDTKAWVLFRLDRFDEALAAIDLSIAEYEKNLEETPYKPAVKAVFHDLFHQKPPFVKLPEMDKSNPLEPFPQEIQKIVKLIVVTHYHRGEILKKLGKTEEAGLEYAWLQDRGFHHFEQLY